MNVRTMSPKKKIALGLVVLLALFLLLGACESSKAKGKGSPAGTAAPSGSATPAPQAAMSRQCMADTRQQDAITVNASLLHEKIASQPEPVSCTGVSRTAWDAFVKTDTAKLVAALR